MPQRVDTPRAARSASKNLTDLMSAVDRKRSKVPRHKQVRRTRRMPTYEDLVAYLADPQATKTSNGEWAYRLFPLDEARCYLRYAKSWEEGPVFPQEIRSEEIHPGPLKSLFKKLEKELSSDGTKKPMPRFQIIDEWVFLCYRVLDVAKGEVQKRCSPDLHHLSLG